MAEVSCLARPGETGLSPQAVLGGIGWPSVLGPLAASPTQCAQACIASACARPGADAGFGSPEVSGSAGSVPVSPGPSVSGVSVSGESDSGESVSGDSVPGVCVSGAPVPGVSAPGVSGPSDVATCDEVGRALGPPSVDRAYAGRAPATSTRPASPAVRISFMMFSPVMGPSSSIVCPSGRGCNGGPRIDGTGCGAHRGSARCPTLRLVTRARLFHLLTFLVTAFALVLQLVLVAQGHRVLDETNRPDLSTRLVRFCSYLTIWSNALVAWSTLTLALGRDRDSRVWRALRTDAVVLILVAGVVHFFLLRPLLDLHGWDLVADRSLHVVVPVLAVLGWALFGPRGRVGPADLLPSLVVPVTWLLYTLVRGAVVSWYPYPFIDVGVHGYAVVLANCAGVALLVLAVSAAVVVLDRRLPARA